jgi:hypothetical protein
MRLRGAPVRAKGHWSDSSDKAICGEMQRRRVNSEDKACGPCAALP